MFISNSSKDKRKTLSISISLNYISLLTILGEKSNFLKTFEPAELDKAKWAAEQVDKKCLLWNPEQMIIQLNLE